MKHFSHEWLSMQHTLTLCGHGPQAQAVFKLECYLWKRLQRQGSCSRKCSLIFTLRALGRDLQWIHGTLHSIRDLWTMSRQAKHYRGKSGRCARSRKYL
ncbi:hypothetical protein CDAR_275141 [Caerostris darwini]|uniref:Uncharacterized protein n=1 Tax=Caerostris darwini TaxID=1538125 RepID=A0AAV4STR8_9ARAC|nr:hypothetical protein CDAR_275141 [Caerostris darwini]